MMEQTTTPLPCPFCGAAPVVLPKEPEVDGDGWGAVACVNARCHAQPMVKKRNVRLDNSAGHKRIAIRKWNQRAS